MADGTYKNIEEIEIGDMVLSSHIDTMPDERNEVRYYRNWATSLELFRITATVSTVVQLRQRLWTPGYYTIMFESGGELSVTREHPVLILNENMTYYETERSPSESLVWHSDYSVLEGNRDPADETGADADAEGSLGKIYWKSIEQLVVGDKLLNKENLWESVTDININSGAIRVYNLNVEEEDVFYASNYLVHNK